MSYQNPLHLVQAVLQQGGRGLQAPLNIKENWKVDAGRQKIHNNNILTILNTANTAMLRSCRRWGLQVCLRPAVLQDVHDGIKSIQEIKDIPGMAEFFERFCKQNQVVEGPRGGGLSGGLDISCMP